MKILGFVYNCVNLLDILYFRESKFGQAQSRKSQQSSCSRWRECSRSCPVGLKKHKQSLCILLILTLLPLMASISLSFLSLSSASLAARALLSSRLSMPGGGP